MLKRFLMLLMWVALAPSVWATAQDVYVLHRGSHFVPSANLCPTQKEKMLNPGTTDVIARFADPSVVSAHRARSYAAKLQLLKYTGPFIDPGGQTFPSQYHWIQQYYIHKYQDFRNDMGNDTSPLRTMLKGVGITDCNNIFFVSTSLNANTACKYAAGVCFPRDIRYTPMITQGADGRPTLLRQGKIGVVETFIIPACDMKDLHPFFAVESFVAQDITLPFQFRQKDATLAEEVNFPFLIPVKYRVYSDAVDLDDAIIFFDGKNWHEDAGLRESLASSPVAVSDSWLRYRLDKLATRLEENVNKFLVTHNKNRVYLGEQMSSWFEPGHHLVPHEAVDAHLQIKRCQDDIYRDCYRADIRECIVKYPEYDFHTIYALRQIGMQCLVSVTLDLSLGDQEVQYLPILIESPFLQELKLRGPDAGGVKPKVQYTMECFGNYRVPTDYFMRDFPYWRIPHSSIEALKGAFVRRPQGVQELSIDITGNSLEPAHYHALRTAAAAAKDVSVQDYLRDQDEYEAFSFWPKARGMANSMWGAEPDDQEPEDYGTKSFESAGPAGFVPGFDVFGPPPVRMGTPAPQPVQTNGFSGFSRGGNPYRH